MEYIKLRNGVRMPVIGFGTFQIDASECERCVLDAISAGYRMIDTAQYYGNEQCVGSAVKKCGLQREELFITSKVWISNAGEQRAYASILESLEKLQTEYIDLMLVHQPYGDYYGTYRALERAYREGLVRAIGVSNLVPGRFVDLQAHVEIKPMVNQVETHVFFQQKTAREYMRKYGCQPMSSMPFAEGRNNLLHNEVLAQIGERHGKSVAQIALRYLHQLGVVIIPKSTHKERMEQNIDIFDIRLSDEEMTQIAALDGGHSLFLERDDPKVVEWFINTERQQWQNNTYKQA